MPAILAVHRVILLLLMVSATTATTLTSSSTAIAFLGEKWINNEKME
jgi:hypothetical protein